jgi:(1->4)-alpha-D-glucan 1-alpha-D-glucosylmutase
VLSEIPNRWYHAALRWQRHNEKHKTHIDGQAVPNANEEYLLYQTLIGTWPLEPMNDEARTAYTTRIQEYLNKALREAKLHSSWINQNEEYEQAVRHFAWAILNDAGFVNDFTQFQQPLVRAGMCNSLAQTLLKITAPGLPDFYQGTERWNFCLVDPDNRRPVDYAQLRGMLAELRVMNEGNRAAFVDTLLEQAVDGRIKLYLTQRALQFRHAQQELFARGSYETLTATGQRAEHVIAFARHWQGRTVLVVASRFFTRLLNDQTWPLGAEVWGDTKLTLAGDLAGCYRDVLTGQQVCAKGEAEDAGLALSEICAHLPVALLESMEHRS